MATTTSSYVEPKTEVNGSSDHGLLHLPQILLRYHTMRGGGAVLKQIQQAFLNRELAEPIKKMWSVNSDKGMKIFHYAETLGVMLDHPDLTWTEDNIAKVKGWLIQMREFVAENPWYLGDSETAHYYRGMKLIAKNAAKIFPKP